jgi:hypothetical protein
VAESVSPRKLTHRESLSVIAQTVRFFQDHRFA